MKKLILVIGFCIACSPLARAQGESGLPAGMSELQAYSVYLTNYQNESYESAIEFGRWIHLNMPRQLNGYPQYDLARNLDRLRRAYTEVAAQQEDPSLREAYLDTAATIFEKVFAEFSSEEIDVFDWKLRQARFYQTNANFIDNGMDRAYEIYLELLEENPQRLINLDEDGYYVRLIVNYLVSQGEEDRVLELIDTMEPYANQSVQSYFNEVRNDLFDSPEERMAFLESQLENNPDDTAILNELADLYENEEMAEQAREIRQQLYEINPNYDNTMALAELALSNANYNQAIQYLREAIDKTDDDTEKSRVALEISEAYLNNGNLQQARNFARQAANLDPQWGQPYIQIASIYGQAVSRCSSDRTMDRQDRVVYWLVLDYLDRARQTDSSLSSTVQNQYQSYQPVIPTTEDKFFMDWTTGEEMQIDETLKPCYEWIDETTTVR